MTTYCTCDEPGELRPFVAVRRAGPDHAEDVKGRACSRCDGVVWQLVTNRLAGPDDPPFTYEQE